MTKSLSIVLAVALLIICSPARAETLYVAERMLVGLHAEAADTSPVVQTVETGKPLEVLQRQGSFVQVRDPQGNEAWVEARYLTPDPPARLQIVKLQNDLTKSQAQATEARAQLKKAQAAAAEQAAKINELELAARDAADKAATAPPPPAPAPTPTVAPRVDKYPIQAGFTFSYLWLGISFAMLGIGFGAGVKWLRESIRKRSGGMYLRV
ncbi:MAG: TIGR04211 family SH3 domain-containing protein [Sulfuricaulis sp.]